MSNWADEQNVPGMWEKETLEVYLESVRRYIGFLIDIQGGGNEKVDNELQLMESIRNKLEELLQNDSHHMLKLDLLGKHYGLLHDVIYKTYDADKKLYEEKLKTVKSEYALEGFKKQLDNFNRVLQSGFWEEVTRHKALFDSFYVSEEPKQENEKANLIVEIQNLYGQFAAYNYGTMSQKNRNEEIEALQKITDFVVNSDLSETKKIDAIAEAETFQSQLKKEKPNKSILKKSFDSLLKIATTIGLLERLAPYIDKIKIFIKSL